ncbi:MAG: alpha/beta fold hydrolase [Myxococcota bacterium]|nr:alpha/beta fold hydrolase [Myxococcota bacterium]
MGLLLSNGPKDARLTLVLAHGAGAGMDTPFMDSIAEGLAAKGFRVVRFEFPYMQKAREAGKKRPPNSASILEEHFLSVLASQSGETVIGGKSMGGRIASVILERSSAKGCICLGYPFHPPGKPNSLRIQHLQIPTKPILILQGERDPFGKKEEVEGYSLHSSIQIGWIPDGEHSFKTRKKSAYKWEENLSHAVDQMDAFLTRLSAT